ncbi:MAG: hypothetical protein DIZ77_09310 [endosymbiont of Seepiophila jonesi]|uniref:Curlin associated repeat-containing protein n=1 Tax=endosymbiont of Lamellibrachia luymesi TaxID=2200907 RepID=A0A370DBV2_9GAMM|nr:MAG: hypothetical protein DIZ79_18200 [endosymbiont of Lamellibrachia luymesi]RDH92122.1 MAG: hypothetical protein DIZ77_09310 [endosymbiont of Seepiophila jonesi]
MEMLLLSSERNSKAPNGQEEGIMRIGIITLTLSTALLFSTAGFADNNTADLDQSGNDNLISVTQEGNSSVSITQNGDHNVVTIDQLWSDASIIQQDSSHATATIFQSFSHGGSGDPPLQLLQVNSTNVTADITFTHESSWLTLHQEGSNLHFEADNNGERFHIYAMNDGRGQFGANNTALITQAGWPDDDNRVYFRQDGESNRVETTQNYYQSQITLDQRGELNTVLLQIEGASWPTINQNGTSNLIDLLLDGDMEVTFNQSGTENSIIGTMALYTLGYPVTQAGNQNQMTLNINVTWGGAPLGDSALVQTGNSGIMSLTQNGQALTAALTQLGNGNTMTINQTGTSNHVEVTQN